MRGSLSSSKKFDVHDLVADVVCRFHEIDERIACIAFSVLSVADFFDAHFLGNLSEVFFFALEESEFSLLSCLVAGVGVLHDAGQGAVGHHKSPLAASPEVVGEKSEGIRVSLKVYEILPLGRGQPVACFLTEVVLVFPSFSFAEVRPDSPLPAVAERRVPQVMSQTGRTDNASHLSQVGIGQMGMLLQQYSAGVVAQTASHAAYFQRVGQPVVYEYASGQREYLRLVLQAAEGG